MSDHEIEKLEKRMEGIEASIYKKLDELARDVKQLLKLESDIGRQGDAVRRIGVEVDDHEKRIRGIEQSLVVNSVKIGASERLFWIVVVSVVGLGMHFFK